MDCSLLNSHSSSWLFNCGLYFAPVLFGIHPWSSSSLMLSLSQLQPYILLHSHLKQDCNSSELPASGRFGRQRVQPCHLGPYALQPSRGFPITIFHDDQLPLLNCYWLLLFYILPLEQGSCCSRFSLSQAIVASGGGLIPHFFSQQTF